MLSAIGKIYNSSVYKFPLKLSIESALTGCQEFILAACQDSEDDTIEYCHALEKEFNGKLKVIESKWIIDPTEGKHNMRRLADLAIKNATNDWVISIDMDEVYRPGEITNLVKQLAILPKEYGGATVNFIHHHISPFYRIFGKLYDRSCRVGRKSMNWRSYDDGFGLQGDGQIYMSSVTCNHYGFTRSSEDTIKKELNFQETLYKPLHSNFPDPRLVSYMERLKNGEKIDNKTFYTDMLGKADFVVDYKGPHFPGVIEWYHKINE